MARKRMLGKRWKGGVEGWEKDMARTLESSRRSLAELLDPGFEVVNRVMYERALASCRFDLGLREWWHGNEATARELFAQAAAATVTLLERRLPGLPANAYTSYAEPAQLGAMAASLTGQPELARKLFSQAELLATGLLADDASPPENFLDAMDFANVQWPYIRVYCLLRLGRLSGFNAFIYTVPLAEARKATPVWRSIDIHQALDTANFCFELWRYERCGLDSLKKKKFEPLLRSLAACLAPGAGEPERLAARKAFQAYQDAINDLHYFLEMYPRLLDLRMAYPHIYG